MITGRLPSPRDAVIALVACLGFCACGGTVASKPNGSASGGRDGAGGAFGTGGAGTTASGGSRADAAAGTGGAGGNWVVDAPLGSGGISQTGGKTGTGGRTGAGGSTAIDAGPRTICGELMGVRCPAGQFCDYVDHCGMITDSPGFCLPAGPDVVCDAVYAPVCGCDGKTYPNDCERGKAKAQKFSDGPCAAGRDAAADTDRNAGLGWQAAAVGSSTGPGIIVMGRGFYAAGTDTLYGNPSSLISDAIPSASLTNAQLDELFARLAAIDLSALPHATSGTATCRATLRVSACGTCTGQTLSYSSAAQLAPEMEPVWAWFDQTLGSATAATNPRTYCSQ